MFLIKNKNLSIKNENNYQKFYIKKFLKNIIKIKVLILILDKLK